VRGECYLFLESLVVGNHFGLPRVNYVNDPLKFRQNVKQKTESLLSEYVPQNILAKIGKCAKNCALNKKTGYDQFFSEKFRYFLETPCYDMYKIT
jgi:hypothetical protein